MTLRDDTMKAVDQYWRGAAEIHDRVGCWSKTGIRHCLVLLSSQQKIEVRSIPIVRGGGIRLEYRLPSEGQS